MISLNEMRQLEDNDIIVIAEKIVALIENRMQRYDRTFNDWFNSIDQMNKKADSYVPITRNRMVQSSGGDNIYFEQITVPFETIIGTPLSEPADYSFDASDSRVHTGMVSHTFNRLDTDELKD